MTLLYVRRLVVTSAAASLMAACPTKSQSLGDDPRELSLTFEYPSVLKPLAMSGSRGVIRANDACDFGQAFDRLRRLMAQPDVRIERESVHGMLLVESFFKTFTTKEICDATRATEAIVCLSVDSRGQVDELVGKAVGAGATTPKPAQDHGFMDQHGFQGLDPGDGFYEERLILGAAREPLVEQPTKDWRQTS